MKKIFIVMTGIFFCYCLNAQYAYRTKSFQMEINSKSQVVKIADIENKTNYVPEGNPGWLIRIGNIDNKKLTPVKMIVDKNLLNLFFEGDIELQVLVSEKDDYIRFELIKATNTNEINNIFWGPFNTTIDETIGEVVGVVRNKDFAIGIQSLNSKTIGGKVLNEEGATSPGATIGGSAATKEDFGSAIQAFCINHALDRIIKVWHHHENCPVAGLSNYSIEGSAISFFGTTPDNALLTIGKISQAEGLPYQVIDGEWIRTSGITGRPYLITQFTEENFDEILDLAERLGFYSIYHEHPFENWGHFDLLKSQFPNGRAGMKACVDKAKDKNIRVGVHTLTNFITTSDPFVTTELNSGLMAAGIALLEQDIDDSTTEILVNNYDYFAQTSTLNSVLIGNEIIRYQEVTKEKPYKIIPVLLQTGQSLVWDGSEQMKLYSDRGRFIKSIDIQKTLPALKKGKHTINIQAKNMTGEEPVIKGVARLKGEIETIIK